MPFTYHDFDTQFVLILPIAIVLAFPVMGAVIGHWFCYLEGSRAWLR